MQYTKSINTYWAPPIKTYSYNATKVPCAFEEENKMKYTVKIFDTTYNEDRYVDVTTTNKDEFNTLVDLMCKLGKKFTVVTETLD